MTNGKRHRGQEQADANEPLFDFVDSLLAVGYRYILALFRLTDCPSECTEANRDCVLFRLARSRLSALPVDSNADVLVLMRLHVT
jgi:hypothetical protein